MSPLKYQIYNCYYYVKACKLQRFNNKVHTYNFLSYMLWQPLTKMVNSILSSLTSENLMRITRELDNKSSIYLYTMYTTIKNTILNYICCL